ncbi:MAG: family 16 glycosylhydrolase [Catonella sp.]|nr:family 16 glycosylhydrolase [Catonella sp.]
MGKQSTNLKRAGVILLSLSMLAGLAKPPVRSKAAVNDGDYKDTPEDDRVITTTDDTKESHRWDIVWSDEFNGKSLDSTKWSSMVGTGAGYSGDGWGNNEQEYYTDGENISFDKEDNSNCLVISANKTTDENKTKYGNKAYTSARLWTMADDGKNGNKSVKFAKTYGRIEARIKVDNGTGGGDGLWTAFWMMPAHDVYGTWASSGEIDIIEARGRNTNSVDGTIHYGATWPNNKSNGGSLNTDNSIDGKDSWPDFSTADFHTYAVEWTPGQIIWYVDDKPYYMTSDWYSTSTDIASEYTYPAPFDEDFYILLNLAVGGNYDNGRLSSDLDKAKMYVDYVRVYDLEGGYADSDSVSRPEKEISDTLLSGNVNENYAPDVTGAKATNNFPDEPETPVEPEKPSEPEKPETPAEPDKPSEPETPIEPEKPTEPEKPSEPEKPTEPEKPSEPVNPTEPARPTQPSGPSIPPASEPSGEVTSPSTGDNTVVTVPSEPVATVSAPEEINITDDGKTPASTANTDNTSDDTEENVTSASALTLKITGISHKIAAGKKIKLSVSDKKAKITWKSSNKKYATVNTKGEVTLKKAGIGKTVTIKATSEDGRIASYKINIMKYAVTKITLKTDKTSVTAGKKVKLTAKVLPSKASVNKKLLYKSGNKTYATVNSNGVVTTKKAGKGKTVTIRAYATDGSGKKATIKIKIK